MSCLRPVITGNLTTSQVPCDETTSFVLLPLLLRLLLLAGNAACALLQTFLCGQCKRCGECGAWRSLKDRKTFWCPSFCMIPTIYLFTGSCAGAYFTGPAYADLTDGAEFLLSLLSFSIGMSFFHAILICLRIKWTIARWQTLIMCECFKFTFMAYMLYGLTKIKIEKFSYTGQLSFYVFIALGMLSIFSLSVVRLVYWIRSGYDLKAFEATYFGHEPECPVHRCCCRNHRWCRVQTTNKIKPAPTSRLGNAQRSFVRASSSEVRVIASSRTSSITEVQEFDNAPNTKVQAFDNAPSSTVQAFVKAPSKKTTFVEAQSMKIENLE